MYSEGLSHRQAADIMEQEESCEELAAMFAILPFANLEEEEEEEEEEGSTQPGDREREEGVVIELSQTGPPTRRLKAPIGTIGRPSPHMHVHACNMLPPCMCVQGTTMKHPKAIGPPKVLSPCWRVVP